MHFGWLLFHFGTNTPEGLLPFFFKILEIDTPISHREVKVYLYFLFNFFSSERVMIMYHRCTKWIIVLHWTRAIHLDPLYSTSVVAVIYVSSCFIVYRYNQLPINEEHTRREHIYLKSYALVMNETVSEFFYIHISSATNRFGCLGARPVFLWSVVIMRLEYIMFRVWLLFTSGDDVLSFNT